MARKVFVHIGLPKTATTYLQTIMWSQRERLRSTGVLFPGRERRDHLWASRVIRNDFGARSEIPESESGAWSRILDELQAWPDSGLISHEFFAAATAEQACRVAEDLSQSEVHVIVTAREPLSLFTASWQESLKNRETTRMRDYSREASSNPAHIWNWRTLDLRLVLERWSQAVPHERIHLLPLNPTAAHDEIWHRFGQVIGVDSTAFDTSKSAGNESMGVVEAEVLRRVNEHLVSHKTLRSGHDRGVFLRSHLAGRYLVTRDGDRFWPTEAQIDDCRQRGEAAVEYLKRYPVDVVGSVEDLRVPNDLPERRLADEVSDAEVAAVATDLVARLLSDLRDSHAQAREARHSAAENAAKSSLATRAIRKVRKQSQKLR